MSSLSEESMTHIDGNLRKAAVLMRSLDADTAAVLLGQLTSDEAAKIRTAMRAIGKVETSEQADVVAELRDSQLPTKRQRASGVELELSSSANNRSHDLQETPPAVQASAGQTKRFDFLESAPIQSLVSHLSREHTQTIAVVLSHLAPERAASVLASLPHKLQSETIDRLSALGDTDPECVSVLERELQAWAAKRDGLRVSSRKRRDTMTDILAAADVKSRTQILSSMKDHKEAVANQFVSRPIVRESTTLRGQSAPLTKLVTRPKTVAPQPATSVLPPVEEQLPRIAFDDLAKLDSRTLSAVLRQVDAHLLALALVGSQEVLVDRICDQLPKQTTRVFRHELRRMGPTRLSDVEAAQRAVSQIAARHLAASRMTFAPSSA